MLIKILRFFQSKLTLVILTREMWSQFVLTCKLFMDSQIITVPMGNTSTT